MTIDQPLSDLADGAAEAIRALNHRPPSNDSLDLATADAELPMNDDCGRPH